MSTLFRKSSLLMSILPWNTDVIVMRDNMTSAFPPDNMIPPGILFAAQQTENNVIRSETTLNLLQLEDQDVNNIQSLEHRGRGTGFQLLMRLMTIYRVIDVLAWIDGGVGCGNAPRFPKLSSIGRHKTQPLPQIRNWTKVLRDAVLDLMDHGKADMMLGGVNLNAGAAVTISRLILHGDLSQRLLNIEVAAMHLGYLMNGNSDFPLKTVDLLKDISLTPLDPVDEARILKDTPTTQPLRLPLHIALFISPIFLLAPLNLHNRDWDRTTLLQTFRAFGNQKPDLLVKYEKMLWATIYKIAMREIDVATAVRGFLDSIHWEELDNLSILNSSWFETTSAYDVWLSPNINRVQVEGELPPGWPLLLNDKDYSGVSGRSSAVRSSPTPDIDEEYRNEVVRSRGNQQPSLLLDMEGGEDGGESSAGQLQNQGMDVEDPLFNHQQEEYGNPDSHSITSLRREIQNVDLGASDSQYRDPPSTRKRGAEEVESEDEEQDADPLLTSKRARRRSTSSSILSELTESEINGITVLQTREGWGNRRGTGKGKGKNTDTPEKKTLRRSTTERQAKNKAVVRQEARLPPSRTKLIIEHVIMDTEEGGYDNPIDLTATHSTLNHLSTPKKYKGKTWVAYGPQGEPHEFQPTMHLKDELSKFEDILHAIETTYVDGKPLHVSKPDMSAFAIFSADVFHKMTDFEVQSTLRHRNIVITNRQCADVEFGLEALAELRVLNRVATIQDQSIDGKGNFNLRNLQGTMLQFYECASLPSEKGKILNVLDCPMGDAADLRRNSFTSDLHAWWVTKGFCENDRSRFIPADDIRWGLAALSGALHWFHIDSDGFGTYIDVQTGGKLWIIARPKVSGGGHKDFANINLFLSENFDIASPSTSNWDLEAIFLEKGSRLLMRPNTPHCVYTHGSTICHGGHFYATSCLQDTLFSLLHSFVAGDMVTNTEHEPSRTLLRRLVQFYHAALVGGEITTIEKEYSHVPPIHTSEGVLDLFSICILTELSNVLSFQTYSPRGMARADRDHCIYARHRSRDLIDWFFANFELVRPGSVSPFNGRKEVYWPYVVRIVRVLLRYKERAKGLVTDSVEGCTTTAVETQIERCFRDNVEYHEAAAFWTIDSLDSFAWPIQNKKCAFEVRKLLTRKPRPLCDIDGLTADDKLFKLKRMAGSIPKLRMQNLEPA